MTLVSIILEVSSQGVSEDDNPTGELPHVSRKSSPENSPPRRVPRMENSPTENSSP